MTQGGGVHGRFNSVGLVRILAELVAADLPDPRPSLAARLGEWLDFKDALGLYSALHSASAGTAARALPGAAIPP